MILTNITNKSKIFVVFAISLITIFFHKFFNTYVNIGDQSFFFNGDINQFMYGGSRLLKGELSLILEFDDKAPIFSLIFAIPAFFKSIYLWSYFNIIFLFFTSYCFSKIIKNLNHKILNNNNSEINYICRISIISFLILSILSPGSLTHINNLANNLLIVSIYFLIISENKNLLNGKIYFILSSFLASVSIGLRPYFLPLFLTLVLWLPIRNKLKEDIHFKLNNENLLYIFKVFLYFFATTFLFIFIFNLLPYLFTNNLQPLLSTLKINSISYLNKGSVFQDQLKYFHKNFYLPSIFTLAFFPITYIFRFTFRKKLKKLNESGKINLLVVDNDLFLFSFILPLIVEIMILRRHFHANYVSFFNPYIIFCIAFLCLLSLKLFNINYKRYFRFFRLGSLIFFVSAILFFTTRKDFKSLSIEKFNQDKAIEEFILDEKIKNNNLTFLFPLSDYYHWKYSESKHGFPLDTIYSYIVQGKLDSLFDNLKNVDYKYILTKRDKICSNLDKIGTDLIITNKSKNKNNNNLSLVEEFTFNCLINSDRYFLDEKQEDLKKNNYYVFRSLNE